VWTGHNVHITDMNHDYTDVDAPISRQHQPETPVVIGDGSWLGHNVVVLPGAHIGRHVAVGAGSVVRGTLPDYCVAAGVPARVIRRYDPDLGWRRVDPLTT
jgi:acetyltransferase-like isoleucine patch superfamily enzyme